jgi:lipoate-protein ligase A
VELPLEPYVEDDELVEGTRLDGGPRHRVYRLPRPTVVLGRGSKPDVELQLEACLADGVPLQRRRGGGCSVLVDPGNVIVSVVLPVIGLGGSLQHFDRITRWIAAALAALGVDGVHREGPSDLALGERKVGGACIYRAKDLLYYSATLLVEPEVGLMERYLRHPPREPGYRAGRGHGEFVRGVGGDAAELAGALRRCLAPIGLWCGEPERRTMAPS